MIVIKNKSGFCILPCDFCAVVLTKVEEAAKCVNMALWFAFVAVGFVKSVTFVEIGDEKIVGRIGNKRSQIVSVKFVNQVADL